MAAASATTGATSRSTAQPVVVRLYTRLYAAFRGFVSQPHPRGAFSPRRCRTIRLSDVRAAMRLVSEGIRNPNFMSRSSTCDKPRRRVWQSESTSKSLEHADGFDRKFIRRIGRNRTAVREAPAKRRCEFTPREQQRG